MVVLPDYTSALVAFLAGPHFTMGVGLVVWFPLAPGETFFPWYHYTNEYLVQVNITNIRNVTNITNITQSGKSTVFTMHIGIRCPQWPVRTKASLILAAVRGTDSTREEFAGAPPPVGLNPVSFLWPLLPAFGLIGEVKYSHRIRTQLVSGSETIGNTKAARDN